MLTSIGRGFTISNTENLQQISGFQSLTTVAASPDVTGFFTISRNVNLTTISGFTELTTIRGDLEILDNWELSDIAGFSKLTTIEGDLYIQGNEALTNAALAAGLGNLQTVTGKCILSGCTGYYYDRYCTQDLDPTVIPGCSSS